MSAEQSCAARTHHSKWQRLSHTGTALPALRRRALAGAYQRQEPHPPGGGAQNVVLQAVRLSGSLASHRHSCSGETEGRVRRRQSISELSPHQESGSHFPVPSSPPTPLSRLVPPPHVMPSGAVARRTRTRMGLLNAVLGGGGGNGGRAGRHNGRKGTPPPPALPSLRWYLPGAHPPHPPPSPVPFVHEGNI